MSKAFLADGSGASKDGHKSLLSWVNSLGDCYGYRLLCMLLVSQFLLKSFCSGYVGSASGYVFRTFHVSGPQLQVYGALTSLPWALKPVLGVLSDRCPIFGLKKRYYILLASAVGIVGFSVMGLSPALTLHGVIVAKFFINAQISSCDLLVEAKYAEKMRDTPERGPDLMSFLHGGMTVFGLLASATIGLVIDHLGPRAAYAICIPLACCIVGPTLLDFLDEQAPREGEAQSQASVRTGDQSSEVCVIACVITVCCAALGYAGIAMDPLGKLLLSLCLSATLSGMLFMLLRPEIGPVICFFFLRAAFHPGTGGASFYFFTDTVSQFPEGPHFSPFFYTTTMGLAGGFCTLVGVWSYSRYFAGIGYRKIMVMTSLVNAFACLAQVLVYTRFNLSLGIPDRMFMLAETFVHSVVGQWMWIPGTVLLSQCCPQGTEATMYALLAGTINLGESLGSFNGAYLLHHLGVTPHAVDAEGHAFDSLWKAALLSTCVSLLMAALLPLFVPDTPPGERLISEGDTSAVVGSPWRQFTSALARQDVVHNTPTRAALLRSRNTVPPRTYGGVP